MSTQEQHQQFSAEVMNPGNAIMDATSAMAGSGSMSSMGPQASTTLVPTMMPAMGSSLGPMASLEGGTAPMLGGVEEDMPDDVWRDLVTKVCLDPNLVRHKKHERLVGVDVGSGLTIWSSKRTTPSMSAMQVRKGCWRPSWSERPGELKLGCVRELCVQNI